MVIDNYENLGTADNAYYRTKGLCKECLEEICENEHHWTYRGEMYHEECLYDMLLASMTQARLLALAGAIKEGEL